MELHNKKFPGSFRSSRNFQTLTTSTLLVVLRTRMGGDLAAWFIVGRLRACWALENFGQIRDLQNTLNWF